MELLPRDVKKALELLHADPGARCSVDDLARACTVGRRTLEKHFRRYLGRSIAAVRHQIRLDQARRDLLCAAADEAVTTIALRHGFSHMGRFASQYRASYGESPSQTLRRRLVLSGPARPLPWFGTRRDRPSLGVQAFEVRGHCARQPIALADEIAVRLCASHFIAVREHDHCQYRLRGKIIGEGDGRSRVILMLLEVASGRYIWADCWSSNLTESLEFVERVTERVAVAVEQSVLKAEIDRARCSDPEQLGAWELTMQAFPRALAIDADAQAEALDLLGRAMELAPDDPLPVALAAWCHGQRGGHHFTPYPLQEKAAAHQLAGRAASLATADPLAIAILGSAYTLAHDLAAASASFERALALDGGCAWAWNRSGWVSVYRGQPGEALERFRIAHDIAPHHPLDYFCTIGIAAAHFEAGRYLDAADWFGRGLVQHPAAVWVNRFRAPAYALAGRSEDARRCVTGLRGRYPDLTIGEIRSALPHTSSFLERARRGSRRLASRHNGSGSSASRQLPISSLRRSDQSKYRRWRASVACMRCPSATTSRVS